MTEQVTANITALAQRWPGETRFAVLRDEAVVDVWMARDHRPAVGALYRGRMMGRLPAVDAALIDIGAADVAFAPLRGRPAPADGAAVVVGISHEARRGKGAKADLRPALSERVLSYFPTCARVVTGGVHKAERQRLERWARSVLGSEEGVLFHAAITEAALDDALRRCRRRWRRAQNCGHWGLAEASPVQGERLTAHGPLSALVCQGDIDPLSYLHHKNINTRCEEQGDLFERYGVADRLGALSRPRVALPGGGTMTLQPTDAVVAVDIDAGSTSAAAANAAALACLPAELRMRGLSGMIVIDPAAPATGTRAARRFVADGLRSAMNNDPTPCVVFGVSPMGVIEMRRDRERAPLQDLMTGPEAAAFAALRRAVQTVPGRVPTLRVSPAVAGLLRGCLRLAFQEASRLLGAVPALAVDPTLYADQVVIDELL